MALSVLFVSGPRRSGKSTVIQQIVGNCVERAPHYLRLAACGGDKRQPECAKPPQQDCGVASAEWIAYEEDRIFEFLPKVLTKIHRQDRKGLVVIEADADPLLRHAYPYDYRLFVLSAPHRTSEVFRTKNQATKAFRSTLDDTAAFVGEIYGLVEDRDKLDAVDPGASEMRSSLDATQIRGLMNSPLGDEIATRILLQPSHHGLLEADIVLVNTAVGGNTQIVDECVQRLERVLARVRAPDGRKSLMYACDPVDSKDPLRTQCFSRIYELLGCTNQDTNQVNGCES